MIATTNGCVWLLVLLGPLTLSAPLARAQQTAWEKYQRTGIQAYKQGGAFPFSRSTGEKRRMPKLKRPGS